MFSIWGSNYCICGSGHTDVNLIYVLTHAAKNVTEFLCIKYRLSHYQRTFIFTDIVTVVLQNNDVEKLDAW